MKIRYLIVVGFLAMIVSCASITEVVPAGKDTYVIAGDDSLEDISGASIKIDLYKKANTHCEAMGKKLMPLNESVSSHAAELRFRCLKEDDPEYTRPTMESVPNLRIETK